MKRFMKFSIAALLFCVFGANATHQAKADPFAAGLIVGVVAHGILSHWHRDHDHYDRSHYIRRLQQGDPRFPEPRPYKEACMKGPKTCYEQDECWRDETGRPQCGIRRYCRRRVYCE